MKTDTTEKGLEALITQNLCMLNGFEERQHIQYDRGVCIDKELLFNFLQNTQENKEMQN